MILLPMLIHLEAAHKLRLFPITAGPNNQMRPTIALPLAAVAFRLFSIFLSNKFLARNDDKLALQSVPYMEQVAQFQQQ
jgi:hypothetical protein